MISDEEAIKQLVAKKKPNILAKNIRNETKVGNLSPEHIKHLTGYVSLIFGCGHSTCAVVLGATGDLTVYLQPVKKGHELTSAEFKDGLENLPCSLKQVEKKLQAFLQLEHPIKIVRVLSKHTKDLENLT
jgi:hypothetical protein